MLRLYQYKYILSIAEHRSLTKAAKALFVSQPYLSKLIAELEGEFGTAIFDRSQSPLTVTTAGECFLSFIRESLYLEQRMKARIGEISARRIGQITFGIPQILGSYILPYILKRFENMYPGIRIIIEEQSNSVLLEHLKNGTLDLCCISLPEYPDDLGCEEIKREPILLVLPPDHLLGTCWSKGNYDNPVPLPIEQLKMLKDEHFILLTKSQGMGMHARMIFRKCEIHPKIFMETYNIETAYRLVAAGIGLTFIPQISTRFSSFDEQPHYFSIGDPPLMRTIAMVYLKDHILSQSERDFIQIAKESV